MATAQRIRRSLRTRRKRLGACASGRMVETRLKVMRSSTITRFRRLMIVGALLAPAFWALKWILQVVNVVRDSPLPPRTLADRVFDASYWNTIGVCLVAITICSLILLYVIVCPPPRDIDQ